MKPNRPTRHLFPLGRLAITALYNAPAKDAGMFELAEVNLISAFGLPGTDGMDMGAMLSLLDSWVKGAADHVVRSAGRFHRHRARFGGSLARFRMTLVVEYLTRECGIRYSPERVADPDNFDDPADSFIHGLLGPQRTGTCASLPVLLVAVGRRLGYPLRLVHAPAHCFCRWETPEERFNIEWHEEGLNTHPDDFYYGWPVRWTPQMHEREARRPVFLQSTTPQQDLAYCAQLRAAQLSIAGRHHEAMVTMRIAYQLWPTHGYCVWVTHLTTKAMYPDRQYPRKPCLETAGREAIDRLVRERGAVFVSPLDPRAPQTC